MSTENNDETMENDEHSSPIEFPCEFIIKMMGKNTPDFESQALGIIKKHFPKIKANQFTNRLSKDNNYLSISVTVPAESKEQLNALYQDLSKEPTILMAL
jgi:putative lipoic acid-binding regulatory protein